MNIYLSHSGNYDYEGELYTPVKASDIYKWHRILLPHEPENINIAAKDLLPMMDLVVAEVSYPSTGQGIEIGLADAARVPIICFYKEDSKPSNSLRFVTNKVLGYRDVDDLLLQLKSQIASLNITI